MVEDPKAGGLTGGADESAPTEARTDRPATAKPERASKIKPRKFYLLGKAAHARAAGRKLLNGGELDGTGMVRPPSMFERGFRDYAVRPRYHISNRLGRNVQDFEQDGDYWMVSDKAKNVLAGISDNDFKFLAVDVVVDPGQEPRVFWLCDIMPMLDAIDAERSTVPHTQRRDGSRVYSLGDGSDVFFHEAVVAPHHAFRLKSNPYECVCDDAVRIAVREAKLTGFSFRETGKPRKKLPDSVYRRAGLRIPTPVAQAAPAKSK